MAKVTGKRRAARPRGRMADGTPSAPEERPATAIAGAGVAGTGDEADIPPRDPLATEWTELDLFCRYCQITLHVPVCVFLNAAESPVLVQAIIAGQFNLKFCPLCNRIEPVEHPFTFFDPARKLAVGVRPAWEWHAGGGEEWYAARLENLYEVWADRLDGEVRIDVVFGPEQLVERYLKDAPSPAPGGVP